MRATAVLFVTLLSASMLRAADVSLNGHTFTVRDGFEIELVASAPLIERPIVETANGVRLCRPQEKVREIL